MRAPSVNGGPGIAPGSAPTARSGRMISLDWLEFSVKDTETLSVFQQLQRLLGPEFGRARWEILRDDRWFRGKGPCGSRMQADRHGQADASGEVRPWVSVCLPGVACRAIGTGRLLDLLEGAKGLGDVKVSRLDVAFDDFDKSYSPRLFALACVEGHLDGETAGLSQRAVTRVRRDQWDWSRRKGGCFWLGGKKSERLLRCYDKDTESGGEIPSTRLELQSRNEWATDLAERLLAARRGRTGLAEVFFDVLVGFVDLREPRGSRTESQRWPRIAWWSELVGNASKVKVAGRSDSTVKQWVRQMCRQFRGFLGVILRLHGVDQRNYALVGVEERVVLGLVRAVREVVGSRLPDLTSDQEVRLEQLRREWARRLPGMSRLIGEG